MTIRESKREISVMAMASMPNLRLQNGSEKPVEDVMVGPWERDKTATC